MIEIKEAVNKLHYKTITQLASKILHKVYDHIITSEQTNYYLEEFQSENAVTHQVTSLNWKYYLLTYNSESVGYIGFEITHKKLYLSKFYILEAYRGKKIGKAALEFIHKLAISKQLNVIELIVNIENHNSIEIYKKNGFEIVESMINSFPNGYKVNDYRMQKKITA